MKVGTKANPEVGAVPRRARILVTVGTRPEVIKMAPLIQCLRDAPWAELRVLATAQHRQMLDQAMRALEIASDIDLDVMQYGQSLPALTARLLEALDGTLADLRPDAVLVQGDTTTVMATALAAFYQHIPVGHVEAGLRSGDPSNPFPEEMNRQFAARIARWHFAPTLAARDNLLREGVLPAGVHLTGNTGIDTLLRTAARGDLAVPNVVPADGKLVLVTLHRRESFGAAVSGVCDALGVLAERHPDVRIVLPVHPNPSVRKVIAARLSGLRGITLLPPLDYPTFVAVMKRAHIVLTDSGGVQEEAPALGKPVLVMRDRTERGEAVEIGAAWLVGTDTEAIVKAVGALLTDVTLHTRMSSPVMPYGDGRASERIANILRSELAGDGRSAAPNYENAFPKIGH